jgi:tetratricopeptide (TPR) repeat protein
MVPAWAAAGCAAILAGVSFLAVRLRGRFPYLAVGWFWYLVTTLPVIGLIQVGLQARADRYMYIPMAGLGIAAAWSAVEAVGAIGTGLAAAAICAMLGFSACAWRQTAYWKNGETLFRRAIAVTEGNYLAWQNLGFELSQDPGRKTEAIACLRTSAQIKPDSAGAHSSLCALLPDKTEALRECDTALQIEPDNWQARNNRAAALKAMGRIPEAMTEYRLAIRERPSAAEAHANLGMLLFDSRQMREALEEEDKALALDPEMGSAHFIRGRVLLETGKTESAIEEFEAVLQIEPNSAEVHGMLAAALSRVPWGVFDCLKEFGTAVSLNPNDAGTRAGFAGALSGAGRNEEALEQIKAAVRLEPGPKWADRLLQIEAKSARPR